MVKLAPFLSLQAKNTQNTKTFLLAKNPESLYQELGYPVRVLLTAALLEIVHAATGLVRSNPWVTAQQVLGYTYSQKHLRSILTSVNPNLDC